MPLREDGPGPVVTGTEAEGHTTGQQDDRHHRIAGGRSEPVTAADIFRQHAVLDLAEIGVRPDGPLDWTPADPPPLEEPLAIARRRELARRRAAEFELRWAQLREVHRYWTEAA